MSNNNSDDNNNNNDKTPDYILQNSISKSNNNNIQNSTNIINNMNKNNGAGLIEDEISIEYNKPNNNNINNNNEENNEDIVNYNNDINFNKINKENDNINIKPIHAEVNIPKDVNLDHNQLPEYNDNNLNRINNQNINEIIDPNQIQIEKFKIPSNLKKTFIVTTILAGLGLILIILGFINEIASSTPGGGIMFWVLGGVVMIPGGYYSYQFFKAYRAKNEYVRNDILENIPVL